MKKVIFSLAFTLVFASCSKKAAIDYALFSGKIENTDISEITISKSGGAFIKKMNMDSNGVFADTIRTTPGLFILTVGKTRSIVYLDHGDDIILTADANKFGKSVNFSGKGAETNNYRRIKNKKSAKIKESVNLFYKLDEVSFKKKAKEISTTLSQVVDTFSEVPAHFKVLEKRSLNYEYLNEIARYEDYHQRFTKSPDFKVSEHFLEDLEGFDFNNTDDYHFSGAYKQLVKRHYNAEIDALIKTDSLDHSLASVEVYSKIPNKTIKNELLSLGAEKAITSTDKFKKYYQLFMQASDDEESKAKITDTYNKLINLQQGKPSPKFINYDNNAGGTLSLDDLKGKYVYIDVWATWCGPCIAQIPYLKILEKEYHGKNITFLSISADAPKDHDKWKKMIVDKKLGGVQVMADKAFQSQFTEDYIIRSIPRFILIDPEGNIVTKKAPRPSSPELTKLFNELNI